MLRHCTCFALIVASSLTSAIAAEGNSGRSDKSLVEGTWIWIPENGDVGEAKIPKLYFRFSKGKAWVLDENQDIGKAKREFVFAIHQEEDLKQLDLRVTGSTDNENGKVVKCIYRLEGDTLVLCCGMDERPTDFIATGTGELLKFERLK